MTHARGLTQVALASILWGTGGLVVQLIREIEPMSPLTISAWRMIIAAVVLLALLAAGRGLAELVRVCRERPARVLVIGVGTAAYQAFYFVSVTQVGVAVSTVVSLGIAPVILTAAESVRDREWPTAERTAVLAAALAGLVLVSVSADHGLGPRPVLGVLLAVASGTTYAVATAASAPVAATTRPLVLTTAMTSVGAVALLPAMAFASGPVLAGEVSSWAWLLYLGGPTMALAYALLYSGLRVTAPSAATTASLLEPVTAAVAAWLVLDETLGALGVAGTLLVLAAVAGLARVGATPEDRLAPDPVRH